MRQAELGTFLRSRRERLDPAAVGFPASTRRRAPGLRREELASLAGVAVSWLAKLEQGRAPGVSAEVLGALAGALRLDDAERAHLFALAGLRPPDGTAPSAPLVTPALRALLAGLDPSPAYVLDRTWRIVAHNAGEAALFPPVAAAPEPPNLLELTFGDAGLASLMADHDAELVRLVAQFRIHATEWPSPDLDTLVARLSARAPRFAELWSGQDVAPFETTRRLFDHPTAGRLAFDHHRFAVLDQPGAQLVVYTSADGTDSARRLLAAS
ncbi:helix-turn-helix transcriptional regulator [Aquihabitans sp. G128]|uniref:helix-turn-helix transcriptional regulator n=1 Tax=Aquihabitans sp. G128 TaxID=2849779 RepID=UPI001C22748F|nr:helix-turn-helix transcriptional regulator [Aquihabitans sp. G128]QXC59099.1 helix-turn-helix transcriptional regulator [Aquihabitans sp. G128]